VTETLDDLYLTWLYSQVGDVKVRNKSRTYWDLLWQMYHKPFVWLVPNDDNRVQDGLDLRDEWATELGITPDPTWMERDCSFLEIVISLSRWLAFEGEGHPPVWFWHLMQNLGLQECTDRSKYNQEEVDEILETVILRTYAPNGRGGLFPLRYPKHDQRKVELWYQLNEYLMDA
jgi:hypothetical protein